ncbi:MAG: hypothetical protein RMK19_06685 [Bacteroidia bacterium]|nr:hypothetical protein [Bacteroidia bacterium]MDW8015681.1 hypothetical protein [Bacteroidia bacterium]
MITLFACPRGFTDPETALAQVKAIQSWLLLQPRPQIILFGDEPGVREIAQQYALEHIPEVQLTAHGTPILSDIFRIARTQAKHKYLAYVNADICIGKRIYEAIKVAEKKWPHFLLVSSPHVVPYEKLEIRAGFEEEALNQLVSSPTPSGADLFIFSKLVYDKVYVSMPPFIVGRLFWDFWLMAEAVLRGIPCIDGSEYALTFHPLDKRSTHASKNVDAFYAYKPHHKEESAYNVSLFDVGHEISRTELSYYLTRDGRIAKRNAGGRWEAWVRQHMKRLLDQTASWRYSLGLYRWWKSAPWREQIRQRRNQRDSHTFVQKYEVS